MINHAEAQSLVSARLDEPLDPIVARELDAHLATCPQCRAFATQTAAMSQALHDMPRLPASPRVRRDVFDTIRKPQTPWTRFQGILAPGPGSAFSTVAAVLVVGLLSVFVLTRLLGNEDDGGNQTTLQAPSVQTTRESDVAQVNPTATVPGNVVAPTATTADGQASTDVPPTDAAPTAIAPTEAAPTEVQPTDVAPTEVPPTEFAPTDAAPTETVPPSDQPTDVPTEVAAKTTAGDGSSNAIVIAGEAATSPEAATQVPTEPAQATETAAPIDTPVPTEPALPTETLTPSETAVPTETLAPTETPVPETPEPTQTPVVESPPIESTTGTYASSDQGDSTPSGSDPVATVDPSQDTAPAETVAPQPTDGAPPIEPMGTQPDNTEPTIGPAEETPGQDQTTPNDGTGGATTSIPGTEDISTPDGGDQSGDPGTSLGPADPSTRIEASGGSWAPSNTALAPESSPDGVTIATDQRGALTACTADGSCQPIAAGGSIQPSSAPIGWIGSTLIYAADSGDGGVTYHALAIAADGTPGNDVGLGSGGASTGNAYVFGDGLLIETETGWFLATPSTGESISAFAAGAHRQQVRLYPDSNQVVSVVDGSILIESLDNGEVLARVPAKAVDFDLSSDGQQLVVSTGTAIEIWNIYDSSPSVTYTPPSGDQIGSVAWSGDSILYVDATTGDVRSIAASDFGPEG